jgi:hypothetical protein
MAPHGITHAPIMHIMSSNVHGRPEATLSSRCQDTLGRPYIARCSRTFVVVELAEHRISVAHHRVQRATQSLVYCVAASGRELWVESRWACLDATVNVIRCASAGTAVRQLHLEPRQSRGRMDEQLVDNSCYLTDCCLRQVDVVIGVHNDVHFCLLALVDRPPPLP